MIRFLVSCCSIYVPKVPTAFYSLYSIKLRRLRSMPQTNLERFSRRIKSLLTNQINGVKYIAR